MSLCYLDSNISIKMSKLRDRNHKLLIILLFWMHIFKNFWLIAKKIGLCRGLEYQL